MATTIDRNAYQFFREHAGGWVGHNAEHAAHLARAEATAERLGWAYDWEWDDEPWDGDCGCQPSEVLGCILRDAYSGEQLASLWGIGDPSNTDRRVIEAELAAEVLSETSTGLACGNTA